MRLSIYILVGIAALAIGIVYFWNKNPDQKIAPAKDKSMSEVVKLKTSDSVEIIGDYYAAGGDNGVLLLHMMPSDRKSWTKFAEKLQANDFKVLAIDLRGHGESQGGPDGYKKFSDAEHRSSILDVEAGAEFLKSTLRQSSGQEGKIHLVGASIGANLALKYLAGNPKTKSAVLLSPGLDYRGVKTEGLISILKNHQAIYAVASEDDKYSFDSVKNLFEGVSFSDSRMMKIFQDAGHGTTIFEQEPKFMEEVISWIVEINDT